MPLGVPDEDRILVREARRIAVYAALLVPPGCREFGHSGRMFSGRAALLRRALKRELARLSSAARRQVQPNAPFHPTGLTHNRWDES